MRFAVVVMLAVLPTSAVADEDAPQPTRVNAQLAGTSVRLQARFDLELGGAGVGLDAISIGLPRRAALTGATATVEGRRHALRLTKAEDADRAFDALAFKPGRDGQRASAILIDSANDTITIDVLLPRETPLTLDVSLQLPTCFYRDVRYVALPRTWWQRLPAAQRDAPRASDERLFEVCRVDHDEDVRWLGLASTHLARRPAGEQRIGTIASRLPVEGAHFAHVELELARQLGDVPRDLHTAIVIDHSRSMTGDELEAQRAIVAAYVRLAPRSHVQVIAYSRTPKPLLAGWTIASHAGPAIDRAIRALPPRNGSNVDAALREADRWLATVKGTRRIVVFSDERLPARLASMHEAPHAYVPANTLVHVVRPFGPSDGRGLERADDLDLAPLAKATHGIAVSGRASEDGSIDATMLLRPTSLDEITIGAQGWAALDEPRSCGTSLPEGQSCSWWAAGTATSGPVKISGLVWNRPFTRVVRPDPSRARTMARVLAPLGIVDSELQAHVERAAFAVNSVWSLFAQWGGSGGYEDLGGFGTIGMGRFSTSSSHHHPVGTIGRVRQPLELQRQLQPAVNACAAGLAASDAAIAMTITVETTREEIVDVAVATVPVAPALEACVTEAVWELTLRIGDAPEHATTRVAFGNKR